MRSLRETYNLPRETPAPVRMWVLMGVFVLAALALWLALPDSPVTVAILAIALLLIVFFGVWRVLMSRQLSRPPERRPTQPPSTKGT